MDLITGLFMYIGSIVAMLVISLFVITVLFKSMQKEYPPNM
jgi:uncharacterized membrane protein YwaF